MTDVRGIGLMVAAALLSVAPPGLADTAINKRLAVSPTGLIEISNTAGTVVIRAWNRNEVEVKGELGRGSERLDFTTSKEVTRVKVVLPSSSRNVSASDLEIKVPVQSRIAVNTISADIDVAGVRGSQRLQAVSGDIGTDAGTEDIECKTVSGDVQIRGMGGNAMLTITTVSGDATATHIGGDVNANTVSGNLLLDLGDTSRSRLRSTSGDLTLNSRLLPNARVDVESISGDVRLDLRAPVNAAFDVSSFNGEIRNCFGPKPTRTSEYAPGRELRFSEGQGGSRVRIKTLNGDINVCRK
jgi:DUF4097 and DUF4098 domain-containing protein YvlB